MATGTLADSLDPGPDPKGDGYADDANAGEPIVDTAGDAGAEEAIAGVAAAADADDSAVNVGGRADEAAVCISELIAATEVESTRRLLATHSPHQSSSRTCGHTPSIR